MSEEITWPKRGKVQLQIYMECGMFGALGIIKSPVSKLREINDIFEAKADWDILLIQEHKLNRHKIEEAHRMFLSKGETYWWDADEWRGGVAKSINKKSESQVLEDGQDPEGRSEWLLLLKGLEIFGVCNVYTPTNTVAYRHTWERMTTQLAPQYRWFVGGDVNFIVESMDRLGSIPKQSTNVPYVERHPSEDRRPMGVQPSSTPVELSGIQLE